MFILNLSYLQLLYHHQNHSYNSFIVAFDRSPKLRPAPTLPTPAVVEQHTEQDEHQQGQRAQDGEQEQGVVGSDVPQTRVRQTQSWKTVHAESCLINIQKHHLINILTDIILKTWQDYLNL